MRLFRVYKNGYVEREATGKTYNSMTKNETAKFLGLRRSQLASHLEVDPTHMNGTL